MTTTAANRPVRKRKTVAHYSDDNPNTFTVKPKRGEQNNDAADAVASKPAAAKPAAAAAKKTTISKTSTATGKKRGRPRKNSSPSTTNPTKAAAAAANTNSFAAFAKLATSSRGGGRASSSSKNKRKTKTNRDALPDPLINPKPLAPPRKRKKSSSSLTTTTTTADATTTKAEAAETMVEPPPPPPPPPQQYDTSLAHTALWQPALPLELAATATGNRNNNNQPQQQQQRRSMLSDSCYAITKPDPKVGMWTPWPPLSSSSDGAGGSATSAANNMVTWFSVRQDHKKYAVAGDCRGRLLLYHLGDYHCCGQGQQQQQQPLLQVIKSTSAFVRERKRVITSKKFISYPNAIVQVTWCRSLLVYLTNSELECWCLDKEQILFRYLIGTTWPDTSQYTKKIASQQSPSLQLTYYYDTSSCDGGDDDGDENVLCYQLLWTTGHRELLSKQQIMELEDEEEEDDHTTTSGTAEAVPAAIVENSDDDTSNSLLVFDIPTGTNHQQHDGTMIRKLEETSLSSSSLPSSPNYFRCWATLWDTSYGSATTFLTVAQTGPDSIELLRGRRRRRKRKTNESSSPLSGSTTTSSSFREQVEVVHRQTLPYYAGRGTFNNTTAPSAAVDATNSNSSCSDPSKAAATLLAVQDCHLQIFGEYVFVTGAAARGIRMYKAENLQFLATFGDTVQLHGKLVVWNRCYWVPAASILQSSSSLLRIDPTTGSASNKKNKQAWWLEHHDELAVREERNKKTTRNIHNGEEEQEHWLVGIPHPFKGPSELKNTIYIWKPSDYQTTTLHGPVGGCLGDIFCSDNFRMVSVAAVSGQIYEWGPSFRTDFAGIMYPVGYKVITDNVEYIEDEDELDVVVATARNHDVLAQDPSKTVDARLDPDLAEALRLSLLEHKKKLEEENRKKEPKISVLPSGDEDEFMVPCRPDIEEAECDDQGSHLGSPQRVRIDPSQPVDEENAFEFCFLEAIPSTRLIRKELQAMQEKLEVSTSESIPEKPKGRGKRNRTANVEVLLQSSVDPEVRRQMAQVRGEWASGKGSTMSSSDLAHYAPVHEALAEPPAIQRHPMMARSEEEKEVAMELLLLSPGDGLEHKTVDASKLPPQVPLLGEDSVVTPSEPSPAHTVAAAVEEKNISEATIPGTTNGKNSAPVQLNRYSVLEIDEKMDPNEKSDFHAEGREASNRHRNNDAHKSEDDTAQNDKDSTWEVTESSVCAACHGRLVYHTCGKREKPIDYDAIARAEEERKEREAAEKQRARMERRRIAEAKRREARRKKKAEEEQKRLEEEERVRVYEGLRFAEARIQENEGEPVYSHQESSRHQPSNKEEYTSPHAQLPQERTVTDYKRMHAYTDASAVPENHQHLPQVKSSYGDQPSGNAFSTSQFGNDANRSSTSKINQQATFNIDGNEVRASTSLHPTDALAALAGLADSLANPVEIGHTMVADDTNSTSKPEDSYGEHQTISYGAVISDQRRKAITQSLAAVRREEGQSIIGSGERYPLVQPSYGRPDQSSYGVEATSASNRNSLQHEGPGDRIEQRSLGYRGGEPTSTVATLAHSFLSGTSNCGAPEGRADPASSTVSQQSMLSVPVIRGYANTIATSPIGHAEKPSGITLGAVNSPNGSGSYRNIPVVSLQHSSEMGSAEQLDTKTPKLSAESIGRQASATTSGGPNGLLMHSSALQSLADHAAAQQVVTSRGLDGEGNLRDSIDPSESTRQNQS